jgi:fumarate hydratase class I
MVDKLVIKLSTPLSKEDALNLKLADVVLISGQVVTGRDKIHKFLVNEKPPKDSIPFDLNGGIIYHCGPIIKKDGDSYRLIAAGPTTSMRVEMYEADVIRDYGIRGIIGKGGMGDNTLKAMQEYGCVYFQTISGAAAYLADRIKEVAGGWKDEEFGAAEAMWRLIVEDFPAIVTMDAHGNSLHKDIEKKSLERLLKVLL